MKLKTLIVSILMMFGLIGYTTAQTDSTKIKTQSAIADNYIPETNFRHLRLGIYGGIGPSWMKPKTKDYESQGVRFTYSYGLLIDYNFTVNYTFSTGIGYNRVGGKLSYAHMKDISSTPTLGTLTRTYKINYLEFPTLLKLKSNQIGFLTYYTQLGLRHSFKLNSNADDSFEYNNPIETNTSNDVDMKDYTSFYRLSFCFAIGAEYAISQSLSAYLSIGYDNGLTNSLSNKNIISGDKESAVIKKVLITGGFLF